MVVQKSPAQCVVSSESQGAERSPDTHTLSEAGISPDTKLGSLSSTAPAGKLLSSPSKPEILASYYFILAYICPVACFAEFALLWKRQSYFRLKNAHFFKANGAVLEEIWNRNYLKAIWNTSPCKVNQCLHKDKCIYINKQKIFSLPCSFWRFRIKRKFSKYVDS